MRLVVNLWTYTHTCMWPVAVLSVLLIAVDCAEPCHTWLYPSGDGQCLCGSSLGAVVVCNNKTQEVGVLVQYCLTSNGDANSTSVVGRSLVVMNHGHRLSGWYNKVQGNISDQDQQTCGYLNRQGRLCGKCKPNHYVSAYSYDIKCYPCTSSLWWNILKYICVAYLPLTVFLCVVVVFRIGVTSPAMQVPVLFCQLLSQPALLRVLIQDRDRDVFPYMESLFTLYGIWNLDFFRLVIPPICLPLNTMQMIALDYLVAVYPLFLLVCFHVLLTAHDRGCRLVVRLWRPFLWCTARLRQRWNVRRSIIDAFATFLLLSYMKFLSTSFDLLVPTAVYGVHGQLVGYFLYYDSTIEYMGPQHKLYASLAVIFLIVGIFFPLVLLLLYPMQWFQKCLNKCHLNSPGLQIFMQCFQGYYRDRTDGGRECRYFAAVYPAFRIVSYFMYGAILSTMFCVAFILLCLILAVMIVIIQPYKKPYEFYNKLDVVMMLCPTVFALGIVAGVLAADVTQIVSNTGYYFSGVFSLTPLLYFTVKFLQLVKRVLVQYLPSLRHRLSSDPGTDRQGDYEDLSESAKPLVTVK